MPASAAPPPAGHARLDAIDFVRGAVMILMVLDHTRHFVHADGMLGRPLDPATTTVPLYLTRWITHLCAPAFVLLAGLGVGIRSLRHGTEGLPWFLFTRGLWLVLMELTIVRIGLWGNADYAGFLAHLQVLWVIGASMVILSGMVRLPPIAIGALGALIIAGHNVLDAKQVPSWVPGAPAPVSTPGDIAWLVWHQTGLFQVGGPAGPFVWADYPLLPWFGVLCAGYGLARLYAWPGARRRQVLRLAVGLPVIFVLLRTWNLYGDPRPWAPWPTAVQSAMSFLRVQKYGPSLDFLLVTLAPALLALAALDGRRIAGGLSGAIATFGRVPFFFYVLQWVGAHAAGIVVTLLRGGDLRPYFMHPVELTALASPVMGGPLWLVYVCWLAIVILLYPICRWFADVKARRRDWWLGYL